MSGIATLTHEWDSRLLGTKTKLFDTRKTTPNFRTVKMAVAIGGGTNHRYRIEGYDYAKRQSHRLQRKTLLMQWNDARLPQKNKLKLKVEVKPETGRSRRKRKLAGKRHW